MSTTPVGNKLYKNIDDLPQATSITDGMKFIIQTDSGTELLDYYNFKVDLGHTAFQVTFQEMIEYTSTVSAFITEINEEFNTIKNDFDSIKANFTTMKNNFDGMRFLIEGIAGAYYEKSIYDKAYLELSAETKTYVDAVLNGINEKLSGKVGDTAVIYAPYKQNLMNVTLVNG